MPNLDILAFFSNAKAKRLVSSETKISLLFDGFFFRYFSLQKSLRSVGYVRFL